MLIRHVDCTEYWIRKYPRLGHCIMLPRARGIHVLQSVPSGDGMGTHRLMNALGLHDFARCSLSAAHAFRVCYNPLHAPLEPCSSYGSVCSTYCTLRSTSTTIPSGVPTSVPMRTSMHRSGHAASRNVWGPRGCCLLSWHLG